MKYRIKLLWYIPVLALVILIITSFSYKKDDCANSQMRSEAVDRLKKFTMLKDYPVYLKRQKKEIQYKKELITLNRGMRYKFYTIKNSEYGGKPILSIFSNERMESLLGTTYNRKLDKFYNELEFECKTTGNYLLAFSFHEGAEGCALGVFASLLSE